MNIVKTLKDKWWVFVLVLIFLYSYYIRAFNIVPDRLLSFDPIFQYRYTYYIANFGHLPAWDELTYYVGRLVEINTSPPLMLYLTAFIFWLLKSFGMSLLTVASYMSAIYGAMMVLPAFLLGKELSNKYGGLFSAVLAGTAPQILTRTFGSSYDNDQLVMFFLILTLYLGYYALKRKTVFGYSIALMGFFGFLMMWNSSFYSYFILVGFVIIYFILNSIIGKDGLKKPRLKENFKASLKELMSSTIFLIVLLAGLTILAALNYENILIDITNVINFATSAQTWIVNVSIAELQSTISSTGSPFTLTDALIVIFAIPLLLSFLARIYRPRMTIQVLIVSTMIAILLAAFVNYQTSPTDYKASKNFSTSLANDIIPLYSTPMGRIITGNVFLDFALLTIFVFMIVASIVLSDRDPLRMAFFITLLSVSIFTLLSGIRFTELTSAFFITLIAAGFGILIEFIDNKDAIYRATVLGLGIFLVLIVMQMGYVLGKQLGPDINSNWDNAWNFLKTQTPELSLVGTWWDPGHMITGLADRRVVADGAHCHNQCMYTINDRIVDLGKIMATTDENVSMNLIRKYQGDSPNVYWIASDDLIGKYQWLQYFGTGCDARVDQSCPLYIQIPLQSQSADTSGNIVLRNYGGIEVFQGFNVPIPIYINNINGALFDEVLYYSNNSVVSIQPNDTEKQALIQAMKPLENQLNFRFSNQTVPMTVWVAQDYSYIVIIPPTLRNTVFTKMFMLEGQGLEHFKQVFRNSQVKIYEVI